MDFIEQLPSSEGFTAILVVVDRLSKQAIFIPTYDTITSMQLAQLFVLHVFSKHGVCLAFLQVSRKSSRYEASLHLRLPS